MGMCDQTLFLFSILCICVFSYTAFYNIVCGILCLVWKIPVSLLLKLAWRTLASCDEAGLSNSALLYSSHDDMPS